MLVARGARLIQADHIAHELMQPGQPVYEEVVRHFSRSILNPDGSVNRPKLAEAAFSPDQTGATRIGELNAIVHPAVIRHEDEWMEAEGRRDPRVIAVVEAALILEAGAADRFDRLIVVTCSEDQRMKRYAQRLKIDGLRDHSLPWSESSITKISRSLAVASTIFFALTCSFLPDMRSNVSSTSSE